MKTVVVEWGQMKQVDVVCKALGINLLFGSRGHRVEPGYNFGTDALYFYNFTQAQAEKAQNALLSSGFRKDRIRIITQ